MRTHPVSRALIFVVSVLASIATSVPAARAATGDVVEWSLAFGSAPVGVAAGPDGNVWVAERLADTVAWFSPDGAQVGSISLPGNPWGIALGPDGAMWVTERGSNEIARILPDGTHQEWPVPTSGTTDRLLSIAPGPDGAMWFTEQSANQVGRISMSGDITEFDVPTSNSQPTAISTGPDGDLWFTELGTSAVGRLTPGGAFLPDIALPFSGSGPQGIATGPGGGVWVVGGGGNGLLRIDGGTLVVEEKVTTGLDEPIRIVEGPDNAMWFTERRGNRIGRYDLETGELTEYPDASMGGPFGIAVGPDSNIWFTATDSATLGRVETSKTPRDTTAPTIDLAVPQDGAAYMVGDAAVVDYACADEEGGSGLLTCAGPVATGAALDTSTPGVYDFTVEATDAAGNPASLTHSYVVFEEWGGKLELPPTLNTVTAGSSVPIWFSLGTTATVSAKSFATSPTTTPIDCTTFAPVGETTPAAVSPASPRGSTGRVMYVWKTDQAWAGTCRELTLGLAAPTSLYLKFS